MTNQVNMPWEIKTYVKGLSIVYGSHGKPMRVKADSDEILEHIVRCVNSHDALVDVLQSVVNDIDAGCAAVRLDLVSKAREVLTAATGESK